MYDILSGGMIEKINRITTYYIKGPGSLQERREQDGWNIPV